MAAFVPNRGHAVLRRTNIPTVSQARVGGIPEWDLTRSCVESRGVSIVGELGGQNYKGDPPRGRGVDLLVDRTLDIAAMWFSDVLPTRAQYARDVGRKRLRAEPDESTPTGLGS